MMQRVWGVVGRGTTGFGVRCDGVAMTLLQSHSPTQNDRRTVGVAWCC